MPVIVDIKLSKSRFLTDQNVCNKASHILSVSCNYDVIECDQANLQNGIVVSLNYIVSTISNFYIYGRFNEEIIKYY